MFSLLFISANKNQKSRLASNLHPVVDSNTSQVFDSNTSQVADSNTAPAVTQNTALVLAPNTSQVVATPTTSLVVSNKACTELLPARKQKKSVQYFYRELHKCNFCYFFLLSL